MAQSWLGRRVLAGQVRGLVAGVKETVVARLEDVFQQMWLNNGNRSPLMIMVMVIMVPMLQPEQTVRGHRGAQPGRVEAAGRREVRGPHHPGWRGARGACYNWYIFLLITN